LPQLAAQTRTNIHQLEAELKKKGLPIGERNPPPTSNAFVLAGGAVVTLGEIIALGTLALLSSIALWRNTIGRVWELLLKDVKTVVQTIKLEVAKAEVKEATGSCKSSDFIEFFTLSDEFIRALDPTRGGTGRIAADKWYSKLKEMEECLPHNIWLVIFKLLNSTLSSGVTFIDMLLKILGLIPFRL
jgi:hypothetical protein